MKFNKADYAFLLEQSVNEVASGSVSHRVPQMAALLQLKMSADDEGGEPDVIEQEAPDLVLCHLQSALLYYMMMSKSPDEKARYGAAQKKHLECAEKICNMFHDDNGLQFPLFGYLYYISSAILRSQLKFTEAAASADSACQVFELQSVRAPLAVIAHSLCELGLDFDRAGKLSDAKEAYAKIDEVLNRTAVEDSSSLFQHIERLMQMNNGAVQARAVVNHAQVLLKLENHETARDRLVAVFHDINKDASDLVIAYRQNVLGEAYLGTGEYDKAQVQFKSARGLLERAQGPLRAQGNWNYLRTLLGLADARTCLNLLREASSSLDLAQKIVETYGYNEEHDFYKRLKLLQSQWLKACSVQGVESDGFGVDMLDNPPNSSSNLC